ncbi:unnamed protein product [Adineta ricciae]|uniref:Uncharacterized protein n=1 Tax=Adineta ricciae TaxID=249248 RepID=A0A814CRR8_ADIRI|nr:unnamed protein product [Adineta ricciae]CAF1052382.1 unnamed protein product [Adineta ricciae]
MYQQYPAARLDHTGYKRFEQRFPLPVVATLATIQMLTTFAIFSLEVAHNALHIKLTNLFVGFWTTIPFTILWISMYAAVCCCRRQSCATHAVVQNILGFIFACILIGINIAFIRQPDKCFFTEGMCRTLNWASYIHGPLECLVDGVTSQCGNTRISLIIAQLICGVVMALVCLIYFAIYCAILMQTTRVSQSEVTTVNDAVTAPVYPTNAKQLPLSISHHHQTYTISSHPYQGGVPVMMSVYPPQAAVSSMENSYVNCNPSTQYATIYPTIGNDRF